MSCSLRLCLEPGTQKMLGKENREERWVLHIRACKMSSNREWVYLRLTNGLPNQSFISRVEEFVQFALSRPKGNDGQHIRCPCNKKKC